MRQVGKFVYFTKKEEKAIFECYYALLRVTRMEGQHTTLRLMRENMIEGNNSLLHSVWKNFCMNLIRLGVDTTPLDEVLHEPEYTSRGNCYRIPNPDKDLNGWRKAMNRRKQWRNEFKQEFEFEDDVQPVLRAIQGGVR